MEPQPIREKAIFFAASLSRSDETFDAALESLRDVLGPVLHMTPPVAWDISGYYHAEMGSPLYRRFVFFKTVVDTSGLAAAKKETCRIEDLFAEEGRRRINIDPGYLSLAKVVLASRKNYSHRIYLGSGVFAELELICIGGSFKALPYTYRDYRLTETQDVFNDARRRLKGLLQEKA